MNNTEIQRRELELCREAGSIRPSEFDSSEVYNLQMLKIKNFIDENGADGVYIGKINQYSETEKMLEPYTGQMLYNFGVDFMVKLSSEDFPELSRLQNKYNHIENWTMTEAIKRLEAIDKFMESRPNIRLIWS